MRPDDDVCLCFRVSLRKVRTFLKVEEPRVPSQLADCQGAGTGCGWCRPHLERLHGQWLEGVTEPVLDDDPAAHAAGRRAHQLKKSADARAAREAEATRTAGDG